MQIPRGLIDYHSRGAPTVCDLDVQPWNCEFWSLSDIDQFNTEYQVQQDAPGFLGFATSGGGEMFAFAPGGAIVCLAFIGMSPKEALPIASSWDEFVEMLRPAV